MKFLKCIILCFICFSCERESKEKPIEDLGAKEEVEVTYEVFMDRPDLFYLSVVYTDGRPRYNFKSGSYDMTHAIVTEEFLEKNYWKKTIVVQRGAILHVGASVVSIPGISAVSPAQIITRIYVEDELVKESEAIIHSSCEYLYGVKEQHVFFNIYTKNNDR